MPSDPALRHIIYASALRLRRSEPVVSDAYSLKSLEEYMICQITGPDGVACLLRKNVICSGRVSDL